MLKWLLAIHENQRLRAENAELKADLKTVRAQLAEEIDSNREREDGLVAAAISGVYPESSQRRRSILSIPPVHADTVSRDEDDQTDLPRLYFGTITREMVETRARDFMEEGARSGRFYDFDELCKAIEANPAEYLSN